MCIRDRNTTHIEVNAENILRFFDRLDRAIRENAEDKFTDSEFEIQAVIDAKQEITSAFNIVATMFQGSVISVTLEDEHRATFLELRERKDVLMAALSRKQKLAGNEQVENRGSTQTLAQASVTAPPPRDLEAPSNDDVDHEIKVYYFNLQMLRSIEDQILSLIHI